MYVCIRKLFLGGYGGGVGGEGLVGGLCYLDVEGRGWKVLEGGWGRELGS